MIRPTPALLTYIAEQRLTDATGHGPFSRLRITLTKNRQPETDTQDIERLLELTLSSLKPELTVEAPARCSWFRASSNWAMTAALLDCASASSATAAWHLSNCLVRTALQARRTSNGDRGEHVSYT